MKSAGDSRLTVVQQMTHQDADIAVNVHGGTIMKLIDSTAIVAARQTGKTPVTASAHLTFAALDDNGRPSIITPFHHEIGDDKRPSREAQERRAQERMPKIITSVIISCE